MTNNHNFLLVDDNKIVCWAIKKMFMAQDLLVTTVNSGSAAISEMRKGQYHSAFLDVSLPDVNWIDLLKDIRKIAPKTKLIVMAGNNVDYIRRVAISEGAFCFIEKPFGFDELTKIIRKVLASYESE